ncbi:hypothetical protein Egran_01952 [Elaphomyces granulatus]|uniref:RBR-type E3 ubiquitin transferase n=1 Tax=Elaphomyces granulatus TaxID=519963 RepID=A0A232M1L4_9EURO|nr:hypothetical protein Egran_01952 [Elaphomyces granulatus]
MAPKVSTALTPLPASSSSGKGIRSEWPPNAYFEELADFSIRGDQWLDHQSPPELRQVAIDAPLEVIRIVQESSSREQYLPRVTPEESISETEMDILSSYSETSLGKHSKDDVSSTSTQDVQTASSKHRKALSSSSITWLCSRRTKQTGPYQNQKPVAEDSGFKRLLKDRRAIGNLVSLKCQHKYCTTCFAKMVSTTMLNESIFPPKCCLQEIPLKTILSNLKYDQREKYKLKAQEYAVNHEDRWYCPSSSCGVWIPLSKIKTRSALQKCFRCRISICSICRGPAHREGEDCPREFGLNATLEAAALQGWQRCYSCRALVELTTGCRHITCKCKAQFCYTCGAPWRTCNCTEEDQARRERTLAERRNVQERNARAREDEAEIADAIAAIENMEWAPLEERVRNEEHSNQRQRGGKPVDLQRHLAVEERINILQESLTGINKRQRSTLIDRQARQQKRLRVKIAFNKLKSEKERQKLIDKLQKNQKSRLEELKCVQAAELKRHDTDDEEEESKLIIKAYRLFKNLPNGDEKERSLLKCLRETQKREREELVESHKDNIRHREYKGSLELQGLTAGLDLMRREEKCNDQKALRSMMETIVVERSWFDNAIEKRMELIERYRSELLSSGEPLGDLNIVPHASISDFPLVTEASSSGRLEMSVRFRQTRENKRDESNDSYTELIDSQHVALQKPRLLRTHKRLVILAPEWFLTTSRVALVYAVGAILRKRFLELDAEKQRSFRPKSIHLSDCLRQSLCKIQDSLPTFNGIMNLQHYIRTRRQELQI